MANIIWFLAQPFFVEDCDITVGFGSSIEELISPFHSLSDFNLALLCRGPSVHRIPNSQVTSLLRMLKNGDINPAALTLQNGHQMDHNLKKIGANYMVCNRFLSSVLC